MTRNIGIFESKYHEKDLAYGHEDDLHITSYWGGEDGPSIQFTINTELTCLNRKQLIELVNRIMIRISGDVDELNNDVITGDEIIKEP